MLHLIFEDILLAFININQLNIYIFYFIPDVYRNIWLKNDDELHTKEFINIFGCDNVVSIKIRRHLLVVVNKYSKLFKTKLTIIMCILDVTKFHLLIVYRIILNNILIFLWIRKSLRVWPTFFRLVTLSVIPENDVKFKEINEPKYLYYNL